MTFENQKIWIITVDHSVTCTSHQSYTTHIILIIIISIIIGLLKIIEQSFDADDIQLTPNDLSWNVLDWFDQIHRLHIEVQPILISNMLSSLDDFLPISLDLTASNYLTHYSLKYLSFLSQKSVKIVDFPLKSAFLIKIFHFRWKVLFRSKSSIFWWKVLFWSKSSIFRWKVLFIKIAFLNSKCSKKNVVFVEKSQIKGYKGILIEIGWG